MQDLLLEKQILNQRFCRGTPSSKSWNSAHVVQEVLSEVEKPQFDQLVLLLLHFPEIEDLPEHSPASKTQLQLWFRCIS